jgi:protein SCO1/2
MKKESIGIWLFVAAVVIIPLSVFGIVKWYENKFDKLPVLGPEKHVVNAFSFKDQYANTYTHNNWKNKIVVANFFFTHCPIVCVKMTNQLKRLQAYGSKNIIINSFTVDPERDTVGKLKSYAERFGISGNWFLLTGDKIELYRFARKDLLITATDGDGGPEDFIHSENLVLIDQQNRIRGFYKGTEENEINRLVQDIKKLEEETN